MQEITPGIFVQKDYPGIVLGAVDWPHGLVMIDSPIRMEDIRNWRSSLLNLNSGMNRQLICLDSHLDRTIGARSMECNVIGHELIGQTFRNRPVTLKAQAINTGAEWEHLDNLPTARWVLPEITFTESMQLQADDYTIHLIHKPGPAPDSLWVTFPTQGVVFIGDTVAINQPPFLAQADIPLWVLNLKELLANPYKNHLIVCSRGGLVAVEQVREQIRFLEKAQKTLDGLGKKQVSVSDIDHAARGLMKAIDFPAKKEHMYLDRLRYGLQQYVIQRQLNAG